MAEKNDSNQLLVDARGVSMDFNAFTERTDDLKEVVVKLFRGKLKKQKFHCLTDLTFQIRYGESVAFIGRNGAGKSTLLKIIAGTLQPTRGKIDVFGKITPLLQLGAGSTETPTAWRISTSTPPSWAIPKGRSKIRWTTF